MRTLSVLGSPLTEPKPVGERITVNGQQLIKMTSDYAIHADNVGKCYQLYNKPLDRLKQSLWRGRRQYFQEFWALRNVSFEIKKGERIGIIGANGSGKSTLLQIISSILRPTEGGLTINGRVAALLELGAGFNPEFTGQENIYVNGAVMGLSKAEVDERYEDIVAFANIGTFLHQPVKTYSSGMYLRLAFAVAVNVSPEILLVDEALSVGDARFQQKCMAKIRSFCESGTVLFVSHDTMAISELCTRVLWIDAGTIRLDSTPKRAVEQYLQYMYEGNTAGLDNGTGSPSRQAPLDADTLGDDGRPNMDGFTPVPAETHQFGDGRVSIEEVRFLSPVGKNCGVYGEQQCEVGMIVRTSSAIEKPIAGYIVKDRLGREVFGDRHRVKPLLSGERYLVTFTLDAWPNLREGDYAIAVALADGTFDDHVQCHFIHDALIIRSIPAVTLASGLFALRDTGCKVEEL